MFSFVLDAPSTWEQASSPIVVLVKATPGQVTYLFLVNHLAPALPPCPVFKDLSLVPGDVQGQAGWGSEHQTSPWVSPFTAEEWTTWCSKIPSNNSNNSMSL